MDPEAGVDREQPESLELYSVRDEPWLEEVEGTQGAKQTDPKQSIRKGLTLLSSGLLAALTIHAVVAADQALLTGILEVLKYILFVASAWAFGPALAERVLAREKESYRRARPASPPSTQFLSVSDLPGGAGCVRETGLRTAVNLSLLSYIKAETPEKRANGGPHVPVFEPFGRRFVAFGSLSAST